MFKRERLLWIVLLVVFISLGITYSLIQPPNGPADEGLHFKYAVFLNTEHRLPEFRLSDGGEVGMQGQHPPFYYSIASLILRVCNGLSEFWQWTAVRWLTLIMGIGMFFVAKGFFLDFFNKKFQPAFLSTAIFMLTPLTIYYFSHINIDAPSVLFCGVILWMCLRVARGTDTIRDRIILAVAFGLGILTKFTVSATIIPIIIAFYLAPGINGEQKRMRFYVFLLIGLLIGGWWYIRNAFSYGTPFLHTMAQAGSGLQMIERTGTPGKWIWFSLSETYLSTFAQRGWIAPGFFEIFTYTVLSVLFIGGLLRSVKDVVKRKSDVDFDPAFILITSFFAVLMIGHQYLLWTLDFGWNAGGRYLLNGMMGLYGICVSGLSKFKNGYIYAYALLSILIVMNIGSIIRLVTYLVPMYYPSWHMFRMP